MTRKEEILGYCGENHYKPFSTEACVAIKAIEWADEHQREGLWDSEKVTEWLKVNLEKFGCFNCFIEDHKVEPNIIEALKQAMED